MCWGGGDELNEHHVFILPLVTFLKFLHGPSGALRDCALKHRTEVMNQFCNNSEIIKNETSSQIF